jgi:hypothetical protein
MPEEPHKENLYCGGDGIVYLVVKCGECAGSGKCQSCNGRWYTINLDKPGAKERLRDMEFCGILLKPDEAEVPRRIGGNYSVR